MSIRDQAPSDDGRIRCRVLILGGGFGGLYTALGLERLLRPEDRTAVTLVNPENFSLYTPLLCEVAGSSIDTRHAINPIRRMLRRTRFVEGEAISLDPQTRTVLVRHPGEHTHRYSYDHLVVAVGARTCFFGMQDVQEHAFTAKTLGDAVLVRNRVIEMLEMAVIEDDPARRAALLTFVVGGGGFTGVEIAGEINELVRQAARAYPTIQQERLRAAGVEVRLHTRVSGASAEEVCIKDGEPIPSRTLVWTSGVAPHPFVAASPLPKDGRGWVTVDAHLRVPGFPGVWALGDCARVPDILHPGHHHPAMAQHAMREADQL